MPDGSGTAARPWRQLQVRTSTLTFSATDTAPADARRFVAETARGWGFGDLAGRAQLLVSEVVTNVVQHAGTAGQVTIAARPAGIRVEVEDTAPEVPQPQEPDPNRPEGRGLAILTAFARRWGVEEGVGAKVVWFELDDDPR